MNLPYLSPLAVCLAGNHNGIATDSGYDSIRTYCYFKKETRGLDLDGMLEDLRVSAECVCVCVCVCMFVRLKMHVGCRDLRPQNDR